VRELDVKSEASAIEGLYPACQLMHTCSACWIVGFAPICRLIGQGTVTCWHLSFWS